MEKKRKKIKTKSPKRDNLSLFVLPIILSLVGLFFIFESSSIEAFRLLGDSFYYFKLQSVWFILGIIIMLFFSYFDYHKLYYLSLPALIISIALLIIVLIPGIGHTVAGARRWIDLGLIKIQPTEVAKFSSILYLSSWFLYKERRRFLPFLTLMVFIITLIMIQPDMGTAIIVFSVFIVIYFLSGQELRYLLLLIPFASLAGLYLIKSSTYRLKRFLAFLNPELDPQGITYHITQILISLSSGGLLGRGFNASRQKYLFLPEAHTDSIFAIIAEELGFVGTLSLILVYFILIRKTFLVASNAKDKFGRLLAGAIFSLISFQIIINLAGMVNLMPLTGVPLPFISYGGSSLLIFFSLMGILVNINKQNKFS